MKQLLKRLLSVALITTAGINCSGMKKKSNSRDAQNDPMMLLSFYKGEAGDQVFVDDATLNETFNALKKAEPGRVSALSYSRFSDVEQGSSWDKLAKMRAPSYESALGMLRDLGVDWPVLVSVSVIDGYLKVQNDRWYAALELALDKRLPDPQLNFGRGKISELLLADMRSANLATPVLMEKLTEHRDTVSAPRSKLQELWQAEPFQFKPISFYSDDERMQRIWTSDRYLLKNFTADGEGEIFNKWWKNGSGLGKSALTSMRGIFAKVTNQIDPAIFGDGGFAAIVNAKRRNYQCDGNYCGAFWAPSSPGVLERLPLGQRDQYDEVAKAQPKIDDIVKYIKSGQLTLKPTPDDGFFIYQRFALEPLLRLDGLTEAKILSIDEKMQEIWTEVYKAGTAKAMETHQKVIDIGGTEPSSAQLIPAYERLILEPLPTAYKRYAQGYSMLQAYVKTLPPEFISEWVIDGQPIDDFLAKLESQMLGLYLVSIKQLGLNIDTDIASRIKDLGEATLLGRARLFLATLKNEPAMSADQRFMAVQGQPGGPKQKSCLGKDAMFWTTLGIEAVPVRIDGAISSTADDSNDHDFGNSQKRVFTPNMVILVDHFAEIKACVNVPLTRGEWRHLLQKSATLGVAIETLKREY